MCEYIYINHYATRLHIQQLATQVTKHVNIELARELKKANIRLK